MNRTHGLSKIKGKATPEFRIWMGMKHRCYNPKAGSYHRYGGRGITVCDRWLNSFAAFVEDMGFRPSPRHSIERKDNNKSYSPENCIWATVGEQSRNRRTNRKVTILGETHLLCEWQELTGVDGDVIKYRLEHGWPEERLLEQSKYPRRRAA